MRRRSALAGRLFHFKSIRGDISYDSQEIRLGVSIFDDIDIQPHPLQIGDIVATSSMSWYFVIQ